MSVRHPFPQVQLPELRRSSEPVAAVTAMRKPTEVTFRTGRDMGEIVQKMVGKVVVRVLAAVGSGKSTLLPKELVKATGGPLVHVVPSRLLAVAQYDWLVTKYTDVEYKLALEPGDEYSKKGVTITSSAAVWSKLLQDPTHDKPLGKVILFLDESHESDAYTYALQKIAHIVPGVSSVVFASANHDPGKLPMRETLGSVESRKFSRKLTCKDWDPHDLGQPWAMSSFDGSVLMFVEQNIVARKLVESYTLAGATAYRLSADMEVSTFRKAMQDCANPGSGIVVLIADYSFRSGFTFDVSTIVDSGLVAYDEVESGSQKRKYRSVYEIERYQAQGRGGRTEGSKCVCFFPDVELEQSLCNLEPMEMDVAAVLFRCYGYAVPSELKNCKFASGKIPKDLVYSFNDTNSLETQSDTLMQDMVHISEAAANKAHDDELIDIVKSYSIPDEPKTDLYAGMNSGGGVEHGTRMVDPHATLLELASVASSTACIKPNGYYMVPGLHFDVITTELYGDDADKCIAELQKYPDMVKGFTNQQIKEIVAMLLNCYNLLNASVIGSSFAANYKEDLDKALAAYPSLTKNWAEQLHESIRVKGAKLNVVANILNDIKPSSMHYVMIEPMKDMEDKVAKEVARQLVDAIRSTSRKLDSSSYQKSMMQRVNMPNFKAMKEDLLTIERGDTSTYKAVVYPIRVGNKSMWELSIKPNDSDRWDPSDFVEACQRLLDHANISAKAVSNLVLPSYVSAPALNKIMHEVRNSGKHRVKRIYDI